MFWSMTDDAATQDQRPDLGALERKILKDYPAILAAIESDDGIDSDRSGASRDSRALLAFVAIVSIAVLLLAPILGVAIYGEHPYLSTVPRTPVSTSVPVSGASFVVVLCGQLILAGIWLKRGALWNAPIALYGVYSAVFAIAAATGTGNLVNDTGYDPGGWRTPIIAAIFSGLLLFTAVLVRFGAKAQVSSSSTGVKRIRQEVNRLPVFDRVDLKRRRDVAIEDLAVQGLITDTRRATATGMPLGELTHMEPLWQRLDQQR